MEGKGMSRLKTIHFDQDINPDGIEIDIDMDRFLSKGRIVSIEIRFYAGEENTLLVKPVLVDAQKTENPLIQTVGTKAKGYVSGEDDLLKVAMDTPFQKGDKLRIKAINNSTALENNVYPAKGSITYYYEGVS